MATSAGTASRAINANGNVKTGIVCKKTGGHNSNNERKSSSYLQHARFNQGFEVPIGDDLFGDDVDHDRADLAAGAMPVLLMPRQRVAVTADRSVVDENLSP